MISGCSEIEVGQRGCDENSAHFKNNIIILNLTVSAAFIHLVHVSACSTCNCIQKYCFRFCHPPPPHLSHLQIDYYNHNIDTSPEFYKKVITTRTFHDRIDTIEKVRRSGIKVCCGGILGMGETNDDRIKMLTILANLDYPPESVPINKLIPMTGTPLENAKKVDIFDFIRTIALARILMPQSYVRLSAGRESMSDEMQALCFIAGVNSIFYGDKLLTAKNPEIKSDEKLFKILNLKPELVS